MENPNKDLTNTSIHSLPNREETQTTSTPQKDNLSIPATTTIASGKATIKNIMDSPNLISTSTSPPLLNPLLNEQTNEETPPTKTEEHKNLALASEEEEEDAEEEINEEITIPQIIISPPTPPPQPKLPQQPASAWKLLPNSTDFPDQFDSIPPPMPTRRPPSPPPSSQCTPPEKSSLKQTITTVTTEGGDHDRVKSEEAGLKVEIKKEVGFSPFVDVIHYPALETVLSGEEGKEERKKKEEEVKTKNVFRKIGGWMKTFF